MKPFTLKHEFPIWIVISFEIMDRIKTAAQTCIMVVPGSTSTFLSLMNTSIFFGAAVCCPRQRGKLISRNLPAVNRAKPVPDVICIISLLETKFGFH